MSYRKPYSKRKNQDKLPNITEKIELTTAKEIEEADEEKKDNFPVRLGQAKLCDSRILVECAGEDIPLTAGSGPVIAKIPILLAEKRIQFDVETAIELDSLAIGLRDIQKSVILTQCKLIPQMGKIKATMMKTAKLFIKGFVHENIEYQGVRYFGEQIRNGELRYSTVDIPFECITTVQFAVPIITGIRNQEENILDAQILQDKFEAFEEQKEKPYCEIVDAAVFQIDVQKDEIQPQARQNRYRNTSMKQEKSKAFKRITEKMIINIRLKIIQNQQVRIPAEK
jgi:hypothetical protein